MESQRRRSQSERSTASATEIFLYTIVVAKSAVVCYFFQRSEAVSAASPKWPGGEFLKILSHTKFTPCFYIYIYIFAVTALYKINLKLMHIILHSKIWGGGGDFKYWQHKVSNFTYPKIITDYFFSPNCTGHLFLMNWAEFTEKDSSYCASELFKVPNFGVENCGRLCQGFQFLLL